jgi:3-oxoacyl-[acyl-carrier protein] reductase
MGKEGQVPYSTSKGGLIGMTRLLARELGPKGVRVNLVAPGFIRTEMVAVLEPKMYEHILQGTALHDMGDPDDVAATVEFLAGSRAAYMTGCTLRIDGGLHV